MSNESVIILITGLIGLFSAILKIAVDQKEKKDLPDEKYSRDIEKFDSAIVNNDSDYISNAFEQLRRESTKRDSDTGRQND